MVRTCALFVFTLIGIAGCGGGGGSDECNYSVACIYPDPATIVDSTKLLGVYDIRYRLSSNSCAGAGPLQQLHEGYEATSGYGYHGYPTIEISSSTGLKLSSYSSVDNTDGKTYFSNANEAGVHELPNFITRMHCIESISYNFFSIDKKKASVTRVSSIDCEKLGETIVQGTSSHCEVIYDGEGSFERRQ